MTITRFRKGQLSIPHLYCNYLDTLSGHLRLMREGSVKFMMDANYLEPYAHYKLGGGIQFRDNDGSMLFGGSGSGAIDELGQISAPVTTPAQSHEVYCSGSELVSPAQSGSWIENEGGWSSGADDILYLYLSSLFNRLSLNGAVVIEDITIYITTTTNGSYIQDSYLRRKSLTVAGVTEVIHMTDDIGQGTTGYALGTMTCNHTVLAGNHYFLALDVIHNVTGITVYGIRVRYHLV